MMNTIRARRVADYFERRKSAPKQVQSRVDGSNPWEDVEDEDDWTEVIELDLTLEEVLAKYSERDRMVIRLRIDGFPSKEVAARVGESGIPGAEGLTSVNVDKVFSRFREGSRQLLFPDQTPDSAEAST